MKESTFYLLIGTVVIAAFYFGLPQQYLGVFAAFFSDIGSTFSYQ